MDKSSTPASFIICTKDRTDQLSRCLSSVVHQLLPHDEIIVIDNSATCSGREISNAFGVRWVNEMRVGSSWARNRGYCEAKHDIVIYIDDDCIADVVWAHELRAPFADSEIGIVTGSVLAYRPDLAIPHLIDEEYSLHRGWKVKRYVASTGTKWTPFDIWRVGVGASMAWRKSLLQKINGFDPALGVGTPAGSSEDIDAFRRALLSNATILYQPSALVWHDHPKQLQELKKMILRYSMSLGAHAAKMAFEEKRLRGIAFLARDWSMQLTSGIKLLFKNSKSKKLHLPATIVLLQPVASLVGMFQFIRYKQKLRNAKFVIKQRTIPRSKQKHQPAESGIQSVEIELENCHQDYVVGSPTRFLIRRGGRPVSAIEIPANCSLSSKLQDDNGTRIII